MNTKQRQFVHEYVVDHNATKAAVRAGYSPNRGKQTGYRLMQMPDVVQAIERLDAEFAESVGITREGLLAEFLFYHEEAQAGRFPAMVGLRGLEGAARLLGAFVERSSPKEDVQVVYTLHLDRDLEPLEEQV